VGRLLNETRARATNAGVKTLLLCLVLAGCHDASKDLEKIAEQCGKCGSAADAKACAEKAVDDLMAYVKANPEPVGDEQNASDQLKKITTCAQAHGVDGNALMTKVKSP
jgi:hypothetical protein